LDDKNDRSFLYDYFNFELLNDIFNEKQKNKNNPDKVFQYIRTKILDYDFDENFKYFWFEINLYKEGVRDYNSKIIMEKYKNGLKNYKFSFSGKNDMYK